MTELRPGAHLHVNSNQETDLVIGKGLQFDFTLVNGTKGIVVRNIPQDGWQALVGNKRIAIEKTLEDIVATLDRIGKIPIEKSTMTLVEMATVLKDLNWTGSGLVTYEERVRVINVDHEFTKYSDFTIDQITNLHFHGLLEKHIIFIPWWDREALCYYCSKDGLTVARFILDW